MNAVALTTPAIAADPDHFRRTLPDPATRHSDPDHD